MKVKNENRIRFVKIAMHNSGVAAKELRDLADALEQCNTKEDKVFALSEIFGVTERTILRDLSQ